MYRVNFPSRLTEEEKLLKQKYKLLREKREQLEKLYAEKEEILFQKKKKAAVVDGSSDDESEMENKPADPKELAKKLVQSGAIVLRKQEPTRTFKRAQTLERKLSVAPRPPPPLKMKLKRVYNEGPGPKASMDLGDLGDGTSAEMKPKPSRYVCHLPTQPPGSLPGSRSSAMVTSMEAKRSSQPQPSSSSSANQPSSSSTFRMKAGSSSTAATGWHKLAEANRRRMNETRGDFVDYKRRGLVSYKDLNESSDDDD